MRRKRKEFPPLEEDGQSPIVGLAAGVVLVAVLVAVPVLVWKAGQRGQAEERNKAGGFLTESPSSMEADRFPEAEDSSMEDPAAWFLSEEDAAAGAAIGDGVSGVKPRVDGGTAGGMQQGDESGLGQGGKGAGTSGSGGSGAGISQTEAAGEKTAGEGSPKEGAAGGETSVREGGTSQQTAGSHADTDTGAASPDAGAETDQNAVVTKDGRKVVFTPCDDIVSPKEEVNLRGEPSTSQGNGTIHYRMLYGDTARRTGVSEETGWSRVEYHGEVLYAVTSYLFVP
ncbi:MAG: hypothetical protein LBQ15_04875 [Clostridium sp.]|nr:hypothetical protein [Clostridium sp.]